MNFSKIVATEDVLFSDLFLTGEPYGIEKTITGNGHVDFNGFQKNKRCVLTSGTSEGDEATVVFKHIRIKYGSSYEFFKYLLLGFKNVIMSPGNVTASNDNPSSYGDQCSVGLITSDGNSFIKFHTYYRYPENRCALSYSSESGDQQLDAYYVSSDQNRGVDLTFPLRESRSYPIILRNGIFVKPTHSIEPDNIVNHNLQGKVLYPFAQVKNINGESILSFDGITVQAFESYQQSILCY